MDPEKKIKQLDSHFSENPDSENDRYSFRSTLAQSYATFVNSLSFIILGMLLISPTTVIGYIAGSKESLSLTLDQASWYGSLLLMAQPIGCLIGGFMQTYIGRRIGLIFMNILAILVWIFLYKVFSVEMLYLSSVFMGITVGFVEAPGLTYTSEICEPRIRGTLMSYTNFTTGVGIMINMFLTSIMEWRTAALISITLPVITIVLLWSLPESPIWLMNNGKKEDALTSLRWLRGWVSEKQVSKEFHSISEHINQTYSNESNNIGSDTRNIQQATANTSFKIKYLFEASTIRPFLLLLAFQIFANCGSVHGTRNYIIDILKEVELPWSPQKIAFIISVVGVVGNLIGVISIGIVGKRFLSIFAMTLSSLTYLTIGICIHHKSSVNPWNFIFLFLVGNFMAYLGVILNPWIYLGEIYPTKTRSVATAITGAFYYFIMSFFTKTYTNLRNFVGTSGCFMAYAILGFVGAIYLWIFLPETEGKSLSEIEKYFCEKTKDESDRDKADNTHTHL